jgi:hypothetical protein
MANLILLIAIILAGMSYTSFTARDAIAAPNGPNWATTLCSSTHELCQYPNQMAYAAAGLVAIWLLVKFVSAIRD